MTAIYDRLNAKGYEIANSVNGYDDDEAMRRLGGPSRKHDWTPILQKLVRPTRRGACKKADLPYTCDGLVMRPSAVDALQDILETHGEVLPLATEDGTELYVFNPRFIIDAFDKERSIYEQYEGSRTVWVSKYAFIESAIRGVDIFLITFGPPQLYFSDRFVDRVKAAKLKGTDFLELWSSESPLPKGKSK